MPRNVRNFWLELEVDGRKSRIKTGPRRADGGFALRILVREDGCVSSREVVLIGREKDGKLTVTLWADGESSQLLEVER